MVNAKFTALTISALAVAMAGCTSDRFSTTQSAPPPLIAAPSGHVMGSQLPPPSSPTGQFPNVPGQSTEMAAVDLSAVESGASEITTGSVAGVWNVNVAGQSCRVATPQTKFGQGYRAGPLRCPAPLDTVKSWNVQGKQLAFYDDNGQTVAQLFSSGGQNFSGQTASGMAISLSR